MRREQQKKLSGEGGPGKEAEVDDKEGRIEEPIAMKKKKPKKEFTGEARPGAGAGARKDARSNSECDRYGAPGDGGDAEAEAEDDGEAEEIELNGFNFSTQLIASPSPPPKSVPKDTLKPAAVSAEQRADQRARLAARIEALRAKRRADSPDGTSARNRHELMTARRREEAVQRKERKKEIRLHHKAATEQTKDVAPPSKNEKESHSQVNRGENPPKDKHAGNVNLPSNHNRGGRGGRGGKEGSKKPNSKKSRPGFEGSLKSSKGKR